MSAPIYTVDGASLGIQQLIGDSTLALIASSPALSSLLSGSGPIGLTKNLAIAMFSVLFMAAFQMTAGLVSRRILPGYAHLEKSVKHFSLRWQASITTLFFSCVSTISATFLLYLSKHEKESPYVKDMTERHILGYSRPAEVFFSFATGWFIFDLIICIRHVHVFKPIMIVHAVGGLIAMIISAQFGTYYGLHGALFETSTIFLNLSELMGLYSGGDKSAWYVKLVLLVFIVSFAKWRIYDSLWPFSGFSYGLCTELVETVRNIPVKDDHHVERFSILVRSLASGLICVMMNGMNVYWFLSMIIKVFLEVVALFSPARAMSMTKILRAFWLTRHFVKRERLDSNAKAQKEA